jgi:hypothetical protein
MRASPYIVVVGSGTGSLQDTPVTLYIMHTGNNRKELIEEKLDQTLSYVNHQQFLTPGVYRIWAESGEIESNAFTLTVKGILIDVPNSWARANLFINVEVFSHHVNTEHKIFAAYNGDWENRAWWIGDTTTNQGGYASKRALWGWPRAGIYWWDARTPDDSAVNWNGEDLVEVT